MRTRNEKILLAILVAILFFGGNFYGYQWLSRTQTHLGLNYAELRADQAEAEVDLQKQDVWAQRREWIHNHEPVLGEEGTAKAQVLEYIRKGVADNKLEIVEQSFGADRTGPAGRGVEVVVKVKGAMDSLCRWMADLQKPESFYAVSELSLSADQDQKSMVCELHLIRYFKAGS